MSNSVKFLGQVSISTTWFRRDIVVNELKKIEGVIEGKLDAGNNGKKRDIFASISAKTISDLQRIRRDIFEIKGVKRAEFEFFAAAENKIEKIEVGY